MGARYRFICGSCGYETLVSGGYDRGWFSEVHTVSCPRCHELSDAEIKESAPDAADCLYDPFDQNALPPDRVVGGRIRCGLDRRHTAELWTHPGPCPRCGTTLERSDGAVLFWD